jgi:uncharacterized protein
MGRLAEEMNSATFRFYAELNDFLAPGRQMHAFVHGFQGSPAVKDLIEALGVPHTEIDLIVANGVSADFDYLVQDGDRISVYPMFEALDVSSVSRVRPQPLRQPRFILDVHLGRLASYMRLFGFDTLYQNNTADKELADISSRQSRILLTRDRGLLKRSLVTHGYCVRSAQPRRQITEVCSRFDLWSLVAPFSRCLECNGLLANVSRESIQGRIPPKVHEQFTHFQCCPDCQRVYWEGSHYRKLQEFVEGTLKAHVACCNESLPAS